MAETELKRQREEEDDLEDTKRQKSYHHLLLSILEDEEDEPTLDLSPMLATLQQELSIDLGDPPQTLITVSDLSNEEDEKERVIRHLLQASDDELGIPLRADSGGDGGGDGGDRTISFGDGLWEFEDEAANYYTLLQSELFM